MKISTDMILDLPVTHLPHIGTNELGNRIGKYIWDNADPDARSVLSARLTESRDSFDDVVIEIMDEILQTNLISKHRVRHPHILLVSPHRDKGLDVWVAELAIKHIRDDLLET